MNLLRLFVNALGAFVQTLRGARTTPVSLTTLWYEDADGNRIPGPYESPSGEPFVPRGAYYQVSRFAEVRTTHLRFVRREEVDDCPHPDEYVVATYGWIDGIGGRECKRCHGTQTRAVGEDWSDCWDADGSREFMSFTSHGGHELVAAMVRDGWAVDDALVWKAVACEKCMNVMGHRLGVPDHYGPDSREFAQANTTCEICKAPTVERGGIPPKGASSDGPWINTSGAEIEAYTPVAMVGRDEQGRVQVEPATPAAE